MALSHWNYPTAITAGNGALGTLPDACQALGLKTPLLVTDPGISGLPFLTESVAQCQRAGLGIAVFDKVKGNPTGQNVEDGCNEFLQGKHDGIIAIGGGSSLDCAKAIALVARQTVSLWAFEDVGDNWKQADPSLIAPVIAVPTTAGTGSEVGRASVITDEANKIKKIIFHPDMLPKCVLLDPAITLGLPPGMTAATGMDALSHNLEALCSPNFHPMAEGIAFEGIHLIRTYLPRAFSHGDDEEARLNMLVASSMGATAFQKGLGAMHALAHSLGARYDKHHGLLNAILMPYVLVANQAKIDNKITRLSHFIGLEEVGFQGVLEWILTLRKDLGIPHTLADIGIPLDNAELIASMAVKDPSAGGNPITFTEEQYKQLFSNAVNGNLKGVDL